MKTNKELLTGFSVLLFTLFVALFHPVSAAEKQIDKPAKDVKKPTVKSVIKKTIAKDNDTVKPDLIIKDVKLDAGCMLRFTIENYSKGEISDRDHRKGSVKIRLLSKPSKTKTMSFSAIDRLGKLKRPGGKVEVTSGIKVTQKSSVIIDVDPAKKISESNEENNNSGQVRLNPVCIDATRVKIEATHTRPDLMIQSFTKSPDSPNTNDRITITVVVKNQGAGRSVACKLKLKVGGESSPPQYQIPAMAPGTRYSIRRQITLPIALTYLAFAKVDDDAKNSELNESNNEEELIFTVNPPPRSDLVISNITRTPENPDTRDENVFRVQVRNQGPGISEPCKLEIKVGGEGTPPQYDIPRMAPGATYTVERRITLPIALRYRSIFKVDVDRRNIETDETNNEEILDFTVNPPPRPDLVISNIIRTPENPDTRDENVFRVQVRNQGPGISEPCKLEIKVGGEGTPPQYDIPRMAPGATYTVERRITLPIALRYRSIFKVDVDRRNIETDETNNEEILDFTVNPPPRPDLVISNITRAPENPDTRDENVFRVQVRNQGPGISEPCKLEIKVGGEGTPPQYDIPRMAPGATYTVERRITLPIALRYRSIFKVDVDRRNIETDETNNEEILDFTVNSPPRPDLVIDSFTRTPENPDTADENVFTIRVRNQGPGVSEPCKLEVKVGGESAPPKYRIPRMASGAIYTVRRSITLPVALTYLARAKVDCDRENIETNETNNEAEMIFRVDPQPSSGDLIKTIKKDVRLPSE